MHYEVILYFLSKSVLQIIDNSNLIMFGKLFISGALLLVNLLFKDIQQPVGDE